MSWKSREEKAFQGGDHQLHQKLLRSQGRKDSGLPLAQVAGRWVIMTKLAKGREERKPGTVDHSLKRIKDRKK